MRASSLIRRVAVTSLAFAMGLGCAPNPTTPASSQSARPTCPSYQALLPPVSLDDAKGPECTAAGPIAEASNSLFIKGVASRPMGSCASICTFAIPCATTSGCCSGGMASSRHRPEKVTLSRSAIADSVYRWEFDGLTYRHSYQSIEDVEASHFEALYIGANADVTIHGLVVESGSPRTS